MVTADAPLFIAIGASGNEGLSDVRELLKMLGRPLHAVVMVVLHRPSDKISLLRDVLARSCDMPVVVATEALTLQRGTCYIGEPDGHLTLIDGNHAHLVPGSNDRLRNRTIDALFASLAGQAGARTIGIVLSGSLDDGSHGLAAIHAARGLTMVLDPGPKPRGMQQNAIDYDGPISFVGSAIEIAAMVQQVTADNKDFLPTSYALVTTDDAGQILEWNAGAAALFGWEWSEICGQSYARLFASEDREDSLPAMTLHDLRASRFNNGERWCIRRDGSRFWANSVMLSQEADGLSGLVVVLRDRKEPRQDATPSDADYRLLAEMIPQLVWRSRDDGEWDWAGPQWVAYTGQAEGASHGLGWQAMVHPDDQAVTMRAWHGAVAHGGLEVEHRLRRADGTYHWFQTRATPLEGAYPTPGKRLWFGTSTDIDNLRKAEQRSQYLAHHDVLTGAGNRALLQQVLEQVLLRDEQDVRWCNLLYIDIDRFKAINDQLGHRGGDELLRQIAERMRTCLHDTDMLARTGGDEFVLVQSSGSPEEAASQVVKVGRALSDNFVVHGQDLVVNASIGVASCSRDGNTPEELLQRADLALYRAKAAGGDCIRIYEAEMEAGLRHRQALERDLQSAISRDEIKVHYQPIFASMTTERLGFEALARWTSPQHGVVSPATFIPIAEECGLVMALGARVLEVACHAATLWAGQEWVAVNVSPAQFRRGDLAQQVADVLARTGLAAGRLELEVTEGLLMEDSEQVRKTLQAIKRLGVRIVLDDFGTGYSSLGYLCRFAFDKVKLDRSFIHNMEEEAGSRAVIKAVVALADSLHLQVTAEGVETDAQLAMLRDMGCDQVQGFLLGRPAAL
ncbi:MAG: EAL domain-containing protein [Janthinobacterium lividum]